MIVTKMYVPKVEDIINYPMYKKKCDEVWLLNDENKMYTDVPRYPYVNQDGFIVKSHITSTPQINLTRPIIEFESDSKTNVGDFIELDGALYEVIGSNTAICVKPIEIENLLSYTFTRMDVSGPNEYRKIISINFDAINNYFNSTSKVANVVSVDSTFTENIEEVENNMLQQLIKYYYSYMADIRKRLYGEVLDQPSMEQIVNEIKLPNLSQISLYEEIDRNYQFGASIDVVAFGLLKKSKRLSVFQDLGSFTGNKELYDFEISKLQPLYDSFVKYKKCSNEYLEYINSIEIDRVR